MVLLHCPLISILHFFIIGADADHIYLDTTMYMSRDIQFKSREIHQRACRKIPDNKCTAHEPGVDESHKHEIVLTKHYISLLNIALLSVVCQKCEFRSWVDTAVDSRKCISLMSLTIGRKRSKNGKSSICQTLQLAHFLNLNFLTNHNAQCPTHSSQYIKYYLNGKV